MAAENVNQSLLEELIHQCIEDSLQRNSEPQLDAYSIEKSNDDEISILNLRGRSDFLSVDEKLERKTSRMCDLLSHRQSELDTSLVSDSLSNDDLSVLDASIISDILSESQMRYLDEEALLDEAIIFEMEAPNEEKPFGPYDNVETGTCRQNSSYYESDFMQLDKFLDELWKCIQLDKETEFCHPDDRSKFDFDGRAEFWHPDDPSALDLNQEILTFDEKREYLHFRSEIKHWRPDVPSPLFLNKIQNNERLAFDEDCNNLTAFEFYGKVEYLCPDGHSALDVNIIHEIERLIFDEIDPMTTCLDDERESSHKVNHLKTMDFDEEGEYWWPDGCIASILITQPNIEEYTGPNVSSVLEICSLTDWTLCKSEDS